MFKTIPALEVHKKKAPPQELHRRRTRKTKAQPVSRTGDQTRHITYRMYSITALYSNYTQEYGK